MGIGTGTALLIGGVASAGAGIAGSAMQAGAAKSAAQQQAEAAQQAINIGQQNLGSAVNAQSAATQQQQGLYSPYIQAGQQGIGTLSQALSTPGAGLLQGWNQQFQAPTAEQAAQTPGYQFALQQGLNAIQNSAAAKGNLLNTGTMKGLANYASGLASTNYQQTYQNAFQNYLQNYNQFQTNQANQYSRLMGLTGIGAGATQQMAGLGQSGAQNLAGIYNANTQAMSQLLGAKGAAQASGTMGAANAWAQGINNIGGTFQNAAGTYAGLSALQGLQPQDPYANAQLAPSGALSNLIPGSNTISAPSLANAYALPGYVPTNQSVYQGANMPSLNPTIPAGWNPPSSIFG